MEHVLGIPAAGDTPETTVQGHAWLEPEDIQACLVYPKRVVAGEGIDPARATPAREGSARDLCLGEGAGGAQPRRRRDGVG